MELTHFNDKGNAKMVDVGEKQPTKRQAIAKGEIKMKKTTLLKVKDGQMKKGDVLAVAQIAGIMGAKRTSELIPMCHNIFITGSDITFKIDEITNSIHIEAQVTSIGQTGVEMEALCAVSTAALTIYDMCKAVDKGMVIENIRLIKKTGGKSGVFIRTEE